MPSTAGHNPSNRRNCPVSPLFVFSRRRVSFSPPLRPPEAPSGLGSRERSCDEERYRNFYCTYRLQEFLKGLIGGTLLVLAVHFTNASLGYAYFVRPPNFSPYSAGAAIVVKEHGKLMLFFIRGILLATSVATMEELLFRSWLPDEISVDLGHHMAMVLSGLAFALFQRSLSSMPALLFLSLTLFGAKQRTNGSLYVSIGLRTGIMLSSFMIKDVGFIIYKSSAPFWLTSSHSWHPFDGVVGLCFCVVLALFLYPRQLADEENAQGSVGE